MADQGAEGLLSPFLRKQRIKAVLPYLDGTVLDYGCGSGELAQHLRADQYSGIDIDDLSLSLARSKYPKHNFLSTLESKSLTFDTVVSMAVIEHVKDPAVFLGNLNSYLNNSPMSKIVITTPHPAMDWVHDVGSSIGLFSKHANEEHEELLDRKKLMAAASKNNLTMIFYSRFLLGANQVAIFKRAPQAL